jgi:anti-sigma-K factor RskA
MNASKKPYPSLAEIHEQEDEELEKAQAEIKRLKAWRVVCLVSIAVLVALLFLQLSAAKRKSSRPPLSLPRLPKWPR